MDVAEEKRRVAEGYRRRGEPVPTYLWTEEPVEPGPTEEALSDQRIKLATPCVRFVRQRVFGSPEAPFRSREDSSCVMWETKRHDGGLDPGADSLLEDAQRTIAKGTGFREYDVYEWILTDKEPRLPRATLRIEGVKEKLPDGTLLRRKWATLTVHAPIEEAWMRRAWRRLNAAWTNPDAGPDFHSMLGRRRPPKTRKVSALDLRTLRLVERLPNATWEERAAAWEREHGKPVKPNTLHQRYRRATVKRAQFEAEPEE